MSLSLPLPLSPRPTVQSFTCLLPLLLSRASLSSLVSSNFFSLFTFPLYLRMTSGRGARSRAPPTTRRRSRRVERVPKIDDVVDIWWAVDKTFYRGSLTTQLHNNTSFRILYDDGETEDLDLVNEHWKFAHGEEGEQLDTQPDADEIIDVVLDGSNHTSEQDPKTLSMPKKAKQKPVKPITARLKSHQTSDDDRDKDYVEETSIPEHHVRQRRSKADSEKPKKRLKKLRRHSTASDKTSTASRAPTRTTSESRQAAESRPEQPDSTSQVLPKEQSKADEQTKLREPTLPRPHVPHISREQTDGPSKNKNETRSVAPLKDTSSTLDKDTSHTPKASDASKPANSAPSQPRNSDSAVKATAHQPPTTQTGSSPLLTDKPASSERVTPVQHNRIDSQRDLAIAQTVPSFLPPDRACLPSSSEPAKSARHAMGNDGAGTSRVPYNHASTPDVPARGPTAVEPQNQDSSDVEMRDDLDVDEGPVAASVPVKVAIRPKNAQVGNVGSGGAARSQARPDGTSDHSGTGRNAKATSTSREATARKRSRESGEPSDEIIEGAANRGTKEKRPKPSTTPEAIKDSGSPERANPLTHFPDRDPTLTTLVNRRLNPIEKHLRSLADDVHLLTSETQTQQKTSESLIDMVQGLGHDMRQEISAIRNQLRAVQADRHEKQEEIVRLLQELKTDLAAASRSRADDCSGPVRIPRGTAANGYTRYQSSPVAPGPALSIRQVSGERTPPRGARVARGRPGRMNVEEPGMNSDDDVNLSPRRVAAPMSTSIRGPVEMNVSKVSQPPSDAKDRMVSVVARQITVWLLETPHEYQARGNIPVAEWAKRTSANAFENVASRLSHFENYEQAHQTLSTSLGNDAVEMSWFTNPSIRLNISRARRNYAAWDPPPTDSEWHCECILLVEVANAFHRALEAHVWGTEDDLSAAVNITNEACASYGFRRDASPRHPNSGIHVSVSQLHRSGPPSHHNGPHYIRTSR